MFVLMRAQFVKVCKMVKVDPALLPLRVVPYQPICLTCYTLTHTPLINNFH